MTSTPTSPEARLLKPITISLTLSTRLKLEALETILQQSTSEIVEQAVVSFIERRASRDLQLVESLATRALETIREVRLSSSNDHTGIKFAHTVTGKEFKYKDSLDEGVEIFFPNSQPLRISRESIGLIRQEIEGRKGPTLMGAIFEPRMPNSIGKAIYDKYKLNPINLSYVVPLLREQGLIRAFKDGRAWFVEATKQNKATA